MAVNRAKLVETATVDYNRAVRRIHAQDAEVELAAGAQSRAQARLDAAKAKVAKYRADAQGAVEILELFKVDLPVVVFEDGSTSADEPENEDSENENEDAADTNETDAETADVETDQNRDVLV